MCCPKCGGDVVGDGDSSPMRCEFAKEEDYEHAAPDEGPFLCDSEESLSQVKVESYLKNIYENAHKDLILYGSSMVHFKLAGGRVVVANVSQEAFKELAYARA